MRELLIGTGIAALVIAPLFFNLDTPVHKKMVQWATPATLARDAHLNGPFDVLITEYKPRYKAWLAIGGAGDQSYDALIKADCYLPFRQCFYIMTHKTY